MVRQEDCNSGRERKSSKVLKKTRESGAQALKRTN